MVFCAVVGFSCFLLFPERVRFSSISLFLSEKLNPALGFAALTCLPCVSACGFFFKIAHLLFHSLFLLQLSVKIF